MRSKLFFILLILIASFSVKAQLPTSEEIGIAEHLDTYIPDDIILINQDSIPVNVKQLIDKPTIFSFVYYNCPGLCSPLLDGLAEVIDRSELTLGLDYQVITISFNPDDTPSLGISKKSNYLKQIHKNIDASKWIWLTGDSANITKITKALGFNYMQQGKDYVHAAAIMAVSPKAKITRYLHGTYFLPFDLKMAVLEASEEKSSPTISKVLKFCFSYDAAGKKYVFNTTKITGIIVLTLALGLFLFLSLSKKKSPTINKES